MNYVTLNFYSRTFEKEVCWEIYYDWEEGRSGVSVADPGNSYPTEPAEFAILSIEDENTDEKIDLNDLCRIDFEYIEEKVGSEISNDYEDYLAGEADSKYGIAGDF